VNEAGAAGIAAATLVYGTAADRAAYHALDGSPAASWRYVWRDVAALASSIR